MTIDDHGRGNREVRVDHVTLARASIKLIPSAAEVAHYSESSRVAHGEPAMAISRRAHDVSHKHCDGSWVCIWNSCGNPYYISKVDGRVHLSKWASGSEGTRRGVDFPPFTTCLTDYYGSDGVGDHFIRYASLTRERLQAVVDEIDAAATVVLVPGTDV